MNLKNFKVVIVVYCSSIVLFVSTCFSGILQADIGTVRENKQIFRLFCHEALRVFHDRLTTADDKASFYAILVEMANKYFGEVRFLSAPSPR
jgi:hypothetical protein